MDIEAIAKDHFEKWHGDSKVTVEDAIIAALTELAAGYELELGKLRGWMSVANERDAHRKERIRQLEADQVLDGWKLVFAPFDCHGTRICPFCGCRTNANAMACCARAAKESILAAPQQPKEGE